MKSETMKTISEWRRSERVNPQYNICINDAINIRDNSVDEFSFMQNTFTFGYAQGYNAAIAELKRTQKGI